MGNIIIFCVDKYILTLIYFGKNEKIVNFASNFLYLEFFTAYYLIRCNFCKLTFTNN